jgi:hypothetical protein
MPTAIVAPSFNLRERVAGEVREGRAYGGGLEVLRGGRAKCMAEEGGYQLGYWRNEEMSWTALKVFWTGKYERAIQFCLVGLKIY